MPKFLVRQYELWVREVTVEADDEVTARGYAALRFVDGGEDSFEYSNVMDGLEVEEVTEE